MDEECGRGVRGKEGGGGILLSAVIKLEVAQDGEVC